MSTQWTELHSQIISNFLSLIRERGVRYFILRNYEGLPTENKGKDVDIVIEPNSYKTVKDVLLQILKHYNIKYYTTTKFDKMRCWYIMDIEKNFGLHIDLIENISYKGYDFFSFEELYRNTVTYKTFTVLNDTYDTVMLLAQNLIAYGRLKEKYQHTILNKYQCNKAPIDKLICSFWGKKIGLELIENLAKQDFNSIISLSEKLRSVAKQRIFLKNPIKTFFNIIRFVVGRFYRIIWCPKKFWRFFAVEAPDGTGKTTFINNLINQLQYLYVSEPTKFVVHHFRPEILPNLGAVGEKAGVMKQDKNFTEPHRAKPASFLSSFIRMTYYWLDYVIGVPFLLRKEVHYEKFTIFDRYIYDFIVDPHRTRIELPLWIRKIFVKCVIQPQLVFILDAEASTIYKRKQELSPNEIDRQLSLFRNLAKSHKRFITIDANKHPDDVAKQALYIICEYYMNVV